MEVESNGSGMDISNQLCNRALERSALERLGTDVRSGYRNALSVFASVMPFSLYNGQRVIIHII